MPDDGGPLPSKEHSGIEDVVARLVSVKHTVERTEVHRHLRDAARRDRSRVMPDELARLAVAMQHGALAGDERPLGIHARTAVRLLETGALASAWLTALHEVARQPLVTIVEEGRAYAWLPGFRDPRVGVPDKVYEITDRIIVRSAVEDLRWEAGTCVIGGWAHFSHLTTYPHEMLTLVLRRRDDGRELRVPARRCRRPDRVKARGVELTRLAWAGFRADVPGHSLLEPGASWTVAIELERDGLVRGAPLSRAPGTVLDLSLPFTVNRRGNYVLLARWNARGRLVLQTESRTWRAQLKASRVWRLAPVRARRLARRVQQRTSASVRRIRR